MEFRLHHIIDHLYNIFLENDGSENCAQLLEEEVNKMLGTKYLNDEHACNVVSVNSLNIQNANDHVTFCGVNWECLCTPKREDRFCKKHKYLETKMLQERLDDCAERSNFLVILVNFAMNVVI